MLLRSLRTSRRHIASYWTSAGSLGSWGEYLHQACPELECLSFPRGRQRALQSIDGHPHKLISSLPQMSHLVFNFQVPKHWQAIPPGKLRLVQCILGWWDSDKRALGRCLNVLWCLLRWNGLLSPLDLLAVLQDLGYCVGKVSVTKDSSTCKGTIH